MRLSTSAGRVRQAQIVQEWRQGWTVMFIVSCRGHQLILPHHQRFIEKINMQEHDITSRTPGKGSIMCLKDGQRFEISWKIYYEKDISVTFQLTLHSFLSLENISVSATSNIGEASV